MGVHRRQTTQEILQGELLQERAAVLARAGDRVEKAHRELQRLAAAVEAALAAWRSSPGGEEGPPPPEINQRIQAFNHQREQLKTRFYELIVIREALGMVHHQRLAELYPLPPKRHPLSERCL